ncbi:MAG: hypothetical protein ACOC1O_00490 [bacterium]
MINNTRKTSQITFSGSIEPKKMLSKTFDESLLSGISSNLTINFYPTIDKKTKGYNYKDGRHVINYQDIDLLYVFNSIK